MANLYLTHKCKRGCPFCFARKVLKAADDINEVLTLEEIETFLNHFSGSRIDQLGLLGGEPFQYPQLCDVILLLKRHHVHVKIFTSATDPLPDGLEDFDISCGDINFIVNVGDRNTYSDRQFANLEQFFNKFHTISSLSYTIFNLEKDNPEFLFDMIDRYDLVRNIRTGIALPIYKGGNQFIKLEDYKKAGEYFVRCAEQAGKRHITMSMDCGFLACMFNDAHIGRLTRLGSDINFMCGAALDIGPGLQAWNCFPLFQLGRVNVLDASTIEELSNMLKEKLEETLDKRPGVLSECKDCDLFRRRRCEGGCKSFKSITTE